VGIANPGLRDLDDVLCYLFGDGIVAVLDIEHAQRILEGGNEPIDVLLCKRLVLHQAMDCHLQTEP
jgi:hypothetical protein